MPSEEAKVRRVQSTSLSAQSSCDDSPRNDTDDIFVSKRVTTLSIFCMYCRYFDPVFWVLKLLRVIWQRTVALFETGLWQLRRCCGNLNWFGHNHPPMVLFTLSILLFAVILTLLAFYVSTTTKLNKVDVSQDWNVFLQSFSNLEFCVIQDNSSIPGAFPNNRPPQDAVATKNIWSVSVKMSMMIYPTREFVSIPHSMTHLSTSMVGKYIGLKGDESKQKLNITIVVPYQWNTSSCSNNPLHSCQAIELDTCIELTGPKDMFPSSNRKPKSCLKPSLSRVDYWAKMNWQMVDVDSLYYCRSRTMISFQHEFDPSLFQPLKKPHRGVIRLHLLHTSFFLYMFVGVVFIYAVIFNHAKQARISVGESAVHDV